MVNIFWNKPILLTNSVELGPYWEANRCVSTHEIPRILWNEGPLQCLTMWNEFYFSEIFF
jgi:hypothetical protein